MSATPEQNLRRYTSGLLASMEKPEPRRTFEGSKRVRELESVIPSKAKALGTLTEKVANLEESLKQLRELRDGIILEGDRAALQSVFTDDNTTVQTRLQKNRRR